MSETPPRPPRSHPRGRGGGRGGRPTPPNADEGSTEVAAPRDVRRGGGRGPSERGPRGGRHSSGRHHPPSRGVRHPERAADTASDPPPKAQAPPTKGSQPSKKAPSRKENASKTEDAPKANEGGHKKNSKKKKNDPPSSNRTTPKPQSTTDSSTLALSPAIPPSQSQQTSDLSYGKGETITILHVAEKPSIAQAIAKGLASAHGSVHVRSKALPVHEFTTTQPFPKAPYAARVYHKVTSVAGHVFNVDFPRQYQSWESVDPVELFAAPVVHTPCKASVVKHLQDEARNVHFMVLWMDCDREGENINFEVLQCCMAYMTSDGGDPYDRVYRAHFSAINPSDIRAAYAQLGKPDRHQAWAVDARQELDLKVGVAFSRFQTRFFQGRYGDLDSAVLSYGPCQTPTLGFCVQRHIDIETFQPEPYWVLEVQVMKRGRMLKATWSSGRSFNKNRVEQLLKDALEKDPTVLTVSDVVIKEKKQGRPVPLNTVALLKACSKALGIGPHAAMQSAERLYLSGYLSYPRTESTMYPKSFDIVGALKQQADDPRWGADVRELLATGRHATPRGGVDRGDHPPITPCRATRQTQELSGDMARIYELVVRHFLASVSPDAVWRSTRVTLQVPALGEKGLFTMSGKELVSPGFLSVLMHKEYGNDNTDREGLLDPEENEEEISIPDFVTGERIPIVNAKSSNSSKMAIVPSEPVWANVDMKERMTTPPSHLTEAELIGLMEKHGIGTDASIATHIENVQKRNYVAIVTGRRLVPSKLGLVLVQGYHLIDSSLVLPQVRSDIESQCNKIALGQATKEAVVKSAIELFRNKYNLFVQCIDRMDVLFGSSFLKLEEVGKPFTRCGLTRRYLTYIPGPPPRLYNKWTESVYPLPVGGVVKQWTGKHCPVENCHFELCLYSVGQPPRTFPLCPRCFNDVDFALDAATLSSNADDRADEGKEREIRKMAGKSLVLECPLPDHHPSIEELTVSRDEEGGALILDPHLGPKWRLVATRDPTVVYLPQSVEKVIVLDKKDEEAQCRLVQIEFKADASPLPNGKSKHTCCLASDDVMQGMVRVYHGSDRTSRPSGRGRGRGRSRSGRGRGRR